MPLEIRLIFESLSLLTGLVSVYYAAREDIRTWPVGLVYAVVLAVVFWADRLYINVGLQGVYLLYNLYSWHGWRHGGADGQAPRIVLTPSSAWLPLGGALLLFTGLLGWGFDQWTDNPQPYWDAVTVALSLVAQYALTRKWLENWFIWITSNVIYMGLFLAATNYQLAALQVIYIALSVSGYQHWRTQLLRPTKDPA